MNLKIPSFKKVEFQTPSQAYELSERNSADKYTFKSNDMFKKLYAFKGFHEKELVGSELLKTLNFALNPINYKRTQQLQSNNFNMKSLEKKTSLELPNSPKIGEKIGRKSSLITFPSLSIKSKSKLQESKIIKSGTMSMLFNNNARSLNLKSKLQVEFIQVEGREMSHAAKDKIRMQMVNWFLENRKESVLQLKENQKNIISYVRYVGAANKHEFERILDSSGLRYDSNLYDRLFWLFDMDGNGLIDYKEIMIGLELFKEHNLSEKVKMFFELCDDENQGYINEEKLLRFFRRNLKSNSEKNLLKDAIQFMVNYEIKPVNKHMITLEELEFACELNDSIKVIIEKNVKILSEMKKIQEKFTNSNILANNMTMNQGGVCFPEMAKLVSALEKREKIIDEHKQIKEKFAKSFKFFQENGNNEEDDLLGDS